MPTHILREETKNTTRMLLFLINESVEGHEAFTRLSKTREFVDFAMAAVHAPGAYEKWGEFVDAVRHEYIKE